MNDYTRWGKAYYETHKDEILAKEKENKRWLQYYEKNKETVKEKARQRYYTSRGLPVPQRKKQRETVPHIDDDAKRRVDEIIEELRTLIPQALKPKKSKIKE